MAMLALCDDMLTMIVGACCLSDLNAVARVCERLRQASVHRREVIRHLCIPPFNLCFGQILQSSWINLGVCALHDKHMATFATAAAHGAFACTTHLGLYQNRIGDAGVDPLV